MKRFYTICLLSTTVLFFIHSNLFAQTSGWTHFKEENTGLGNSDINAIAVDSAGNQWFATNGGISEFNGTSWKAYTMHDYGVPDKSIKTIACDRSGNVWAGTPGFGLLKFDGKKWSVYNSTNSNLPDNNINDLKMQGDTLWVGTGMGLAKIFGDSISAFTFFSAYNNFTFKEVDKLALDGSGRLWVGSNGDVFYGKPGDWTDVDQKGQIPLTSNVAITAMAPGGGNTMWIAQGQLYDYTIDDFTYKAWKLQNPYPNDATKKILAYQLINFGGKLWVGMAKAFTGPSYGLAYLQDSTWTFVGNSAYPINSVNSNFYAVGDSLYFGANIETKYSSSTPALIHYKDGGMTFYTNQTTGMSTNNIHGIAFDKNNHLWMGTFSDGPVNAFLNVYDGTNFQEYDTTHVKINDAIATDLTFDHNGNLWFGTTQGGVVRFDGKTFTEFDTDNSKVPGNYIQTIAVDQNNHIWVGTRPNYTLHQSGGLAMYDGKTWTVYDSTNTAMTSNYIEAIVVDNNNHIWVGTKNYPATDLDGGLVEYDGTNWTVQINGANKHSVGNAEILALAVDKNNNIYAGSDGTYLHIFDGTNWTGMLIPDPNGSNSTNPINDIYIDSKNHIWTLATQVLAEYNGSQWTEYTTTNSPLTAYFEDGNKIIEGPNGYMWASSSDGLYKIPGDTTIFTANQKDLANLQIPQKISLDQNYPNPFNPSTNISFSLPKAMKVHLMIYDILGRQVADLTSSKISAGIHNITWNASNNASGIYFYRLITPNNIITKKMILLK